MQDYTVVNEAGLITKDDIAHAVGEVIQLDPNDANTQAWVADLIITLNAPQADASATADTSAATTDTVAPDASSATTDATVPLMPASPFQIEVVYDTNASDDDKAGTLDWVRSMTDELGADEAGIPACVTAVTVRRVS